MNLSEELNNFVITWGELASKWGLNRTEANIHALLFISPEPLTMEEIADLLQVARSNVSMSLRELQSWNIVKPVGTIRDRRRRYAAEKDVWILFRNVFNEQKRRNIDPFIQLLKETKGAIEVRGSKATQDQHAMDQVKAMLDFFDVTMSWYEQVNGMSISTVRKYLTLGSKIRKILKSD